MPTTTVVAALTMPYQNFLSELATSIQVYGNYLLANCTGSTCRPPFNDNATVASTARMGAIRCTLGGTDDTHCDSATGNYAATSRLNGFHLWANDSFGREFAHFYSFYKVTLP